MRTISVAFLALGLAVCASACKKRADSPDVAPTADLRSGGPSAPVSGKPTIAIGKSTGVVAGPKDADGRIDYAAAINERMSQGVTAENNANVALWKAFGPNPPGNTKVPAGYFKMLGMADPPAGGDYLIGQREYAQKSGGNVEQMTTALGKLNQQPWARVDNPTIAAWLEANQQPLAAVIEATKKTQYYNPLVPERTAKGSKGLISALLPQVQAYREFGAALACRAMLSVGENQPAAAWQDLLACHRLARLVGRGGTLIEALVGLALEQIACRAELAFLDRAKPDAKTIEQCLRDLRALPALPDVGDKIDFTERCMFLDIIVQFDKQGVDFLETIGLEGGKGAFPLAEFMLDDINWNPALKIGNEWYDRLVDCARGKDRPTRVAKWETFERDIRELGKRAKDMPRVSKAILDAHDFGKARGEALGNIFISLLLPAANKVLDASDRISQTHENVITAFACEWYHKFNGKYPAKLGDLVPTYLTTVPTDVFSGKELIYQPHPTGFLLYSVGPNGTDDGARAYDSDPPGDDIVVRVPLAPKP